MLSVTPLATVFPSLIHVIFGVGFPVALQWNVAVSDSITVWSVGVVDRLGATEIDHVLSFICFLKLMLKQTRVSDTFSFRHKTSNKNV